MHTKDKIINIINLNKKKNLIVRIKREYKIEEIYYRTNYTKDKKKNIIHLNTDI